MKTEAITHVSDIQHLFPPSTLTKKQTHMETRIIGDERLTVFIRHDDSCGNGHNSFAITADLDEKTNGRWRNAAGGCMHDEVERFFPKLKPYIKWHLTSTDGPMHYLANTTYHASSIDKEQGQFWVYLNDDTIPIRRKLLGIFDKDDMIAIRLRYPDDVIQTEMYPNPQAKEANLEHARSTAVWPDATLDQLLDRDALLARLPALMNEFKTAVESLGLEY